MNAVFIMHPLEGMNYEKDTSLALMWAAQERGHRVFYVPNTGLSWSDGQVRFQALEVVPRRDPENIFERKNPLVLNADEVDLVFIRTDPPFDAQYLLNTWLLDRLPERVTVVNRPAGIRSANEKLWTLQFSGYIPPTLVSSDRLQIRDFIKEHGVVVLKPTGGFGGQGIFKVHHDDFNRNVIAETLTENFIKPIIVQSYLPQAADGDKRILLLNGEPLGAVLRLHPADDHRNNFFAGGKPVTAQITDRDQEIISAIRSELRRMGLYFVGIDILGDRLIEVNVTSPTCLQEINRLYDKNLEHDVLKFAEGLNRTNH
ncbi:MAG: glutathione synthase [Candidatus Omnitrophota bacterium]